MLPTVQVHAFECDLTNTSQVSDVCQQIRQIGGLDILINSAGMGYYKGFLEHSLSEHDAILDLNVRGLIHITQHLLPLMLEKGLR